MDHFIRIIHLHQMDDDIAHVKDQAGLPSGEAAMDQLLHLVRARQETEAEIHAEGLVLAEEANHITRVWAPEPGNLQVSP
jgi:hypothetical protein